MHLSVYELQLGQKKYQSVESFVLSEIVSSIFHNFLRYL